MEGMKSIVRLRRFAADDLEQLNRWVSTDELLLQFAGPGLSRPITLEAWLAPDDHTNEVFAVDHGGNQGSVGHAQLRGIDVSGGVCRIARVLIGEPSMRGQGLGGKIIDALVDRAITGLGLDRVTLNVFPENHSAIRCYERCGFRLSGKPSEVPGAGVEMFYPGVQLV
jgi:RimJ/RimL family protein N-acetyltransferase